MWYIVSTGLHGYLPNNVGVAKKKADALAIAMDEKKAFLDWGFDSDPDIRVEGNIRRDMRYEVLRHGFDGGWVPWQYISIECYSDSELSPEERENLEDIYNNGWAC